MESFEMEKKHTVKSTKTFSSGSRINIGLHTLTTVMLAVTLGLVGYNVHQTKSIMKPCPTKTLSEQYPGYFRNETLQKQYNESLRRFHHPVNLLDDISGPLLHNGCCKSSSMFISPPTEENMDTNVTMTLAKDGNNKQFFMVEKCVGIDHPNCTTCNCVQEEVIFTAVYYHTGAVRNRDSYGIFRFKSPSGCCICLN